MKNITFIKPKKQVGKVKLTLHKSGKLGFSREADKALNISENRYVKFGTDDLKNIYLKTQKELDDECFRITKAGEYFYLNYSELLEVLNVKKSDNVTFDLVHNDNQYFKLVKRNY